MLASTIIPSPLDKTEIFKGFVFAAMTYGIYQATFPYPVDLSHEARKPVLKLSEATNLIPDTSDTLLVAFDEPQSMPRQWQEIINRCGLNTCYIDMVSYLSSNILNGWGVSHGLPNIRASSDHEDAFDTLVIEFPVSVDIDRSVDLTIDLGVTLSDKLNLPHNVLVKCESMV